MKRGLLTSLSGVLLLTPCAVRAQSYGQYGDFTYLSNSTCITLVGYTGPGGAVTLPTTIDGLPVTGMGHRAFGFCPSLTSVTIPGSFTSIGMEAFLGCGSLTNVTIPDSVTSIGPEAFGNCTSLTSITIPDSVRSIGGGVFRYCTGLTSVTIPSSVASIGTALFYGCGSLITVTIGNGAAYIERGAFAFCPSLTGVYFEGNAPELDPEAFDGPMNATVFFLPGTTGWGPTLDGLPTAPWVLPAPVILTTSPSFGVRTNQFGFIISWATNASVVVEACTELASPNWSPVGTNTLNEGWSYFSGPEWTNYTNRFYRVRSP